MLHLRTITTASGSTAVQVIRYQERKRIVVKHIGSARTQEELQSLRQTARQWIDHATQQQSLFPLKNKGGSTLIPINKLRNLGSYYSLQKKSSLSCFVFSGFLPQSGFCWIWF